MFALKDLNELLDKMPLWKKMKEAPDRIDILEQRIEALETRLAGTGDICDKCKQPTLEFDSSKIIEKTLGITEITYKCSNCGYLKVVTKTDYFFFMYATFIKCNLQASVGFIIGSIFIITFMFFFSAISRSSFTLLILSLISSAKFSSSASIVTFGAK